MTARTSGIVVGSRKAGTTWLYENMRLDPGISVPESVKETRFFAGEISASEYDRLFEGAGGRRIEVDTALATASGVVERIRVYDPDMRVALILREPVDFAVSRFIHGLRKGDVSGVDVAAAVRSDPVLRAELDYPAILAEFSALAGFRVFRFDDLQRDPVVFYRAIRHHLTGLDSAEGPFVTDAINEARSSRFGAVTVALSRMAVFARRRGLHRLVGAAKRLGVHRALERPVESDDRLSMIRSAAAAVQSEFPDSISRYVSIPSCVS